MLKEDSVIKLSENVLIRLEETLKTCFLYNIQTDLIWTGNESSYEVISKIDGKTSIKLLFEKIKPLFLNFSKNDIESVFIGLIEELLEKEFLVVVGVKNGV